MGGVAMVRLAAGLLGGALAAGPAGAGEQVDLELVLAVDVSDSIDADEARLQREGYIAAFRHADVIEAIENGRHGRVAVAYFEWAGADHTRVIADWTVLADRKTAHAFADALSRNPPVTARHTSISSAIGFALPWLEDNGFDGARRVVDVSGDGPNNSGEPATVARDRAIAAGVTVNGLPIINGRPGPGGWPAMPHLDLYYQDCVIGGPGAFMIVAGSFDEFAGAVRRKLVTEIAGLTPPRPGPLLRPAAETRIKPWFAPPTERTSPPCDIGDHRWQ
jgi:hypothetical protein